MNRRQISAVFGAALLLMLIAGIGIGLGQSWSTLKVSMQRLESRILQRCTTHVEQTNITPISHSTAVTAPSITQTVTSRPSTNSIRFGIIGDYGKPSSNEGAVATMVHGWKPDFVITTGDNNYSAGNADCLDQDIGQYYSRYISPYHGDYPSVPGQNRFFPALGNHDWEKGGLEAYLNYFPIQESVVNTGSSGNERYYDFIQGPVHFFAIDSDPAEPDGTTVDSAQAAWLQTALAASATPWQVVYFHHPPYSSSTVHGSHPYMQWPFAAWGADIVLSGHDHTYERLAIDGVLYFVNGLGGKSIYPLGEPVAGSQVRYNDTYGAMLVEANATQITLEFYAIANGGTRIDQALLSASSMQPKQSSP